MSSIKQRYSTHIITSDTTETATDPSLVKLVTWELNPTHEPDWNKRPDKLVKRYPKTFLDGLKKKNNKKLN